jgi:iron complex outermembrane receptor protein
MQSRTGAWLKAGIGSRLSLITAVQRESSQNDFLYKNPHWPGLDSRRNEHGAYQLWSIRQGIGIAISDVWFMEFDYWAAFGDRELSPNMTEWSSRRYQLDNQHRLKWATNARWKQNEFSLYSGFVSHENLYRDSASAIYSDNLSRTLSSGAVLKGRKGNVLYAAMLRHDMQSGSSSTYSALQQALHASGELGYRYKAGRLKIDFLAKFKQSIIDNQWGPPSPELGFDMAFIGSQSFGLRFFVKRQFRFPTLNERFWEPGGNPNLLPEEGWGQFADLSYQFRKGLSQSGVKLSAYHQKVDNYILWAPNSIGLWEASNLESVNAIGLEASLDQELDVRSLNVSLSATYGFHKLGSKNEAGEWEQAIYAPQHQGLLAADIGYKNLKIGTDLQFTGLRFTTTDNSESLPGFNTWNAYLSYSFPFRDSHTLVAGLYLDNLLSADYQTVANRPMPGRSIRFSLKYEFVKGGQR